VESHADLDGSDYSAFVGWKTDGSNCSGSVCKGWNTGALEEPFRRWPSEYMYDPTHTSHFCVVAYRLFPFLTDLYGSGVRMCHRQVKRPSGDAYLNTYHNLFFLGRIQTPVFSDRPFFFLRVYVSRAVELAFRRYLFEYMCNPPHIILDSRLQGTAHESQEIELQGVMIWFLINSRVRVMISDS